MSRIIVRETRVSLGRFGRPATSDINSEDFLWMSCLKTFFLTWKSFPFEISWFKVESHRIKRHNLMVTPMYLYRQNHWFSLIFIDIHCIYGIYETTQLRCRWSGGMTSSDAAECFAEAPGYPGARPDRIWRPAQAHTPSNQISQIWDFQDFHDLVLHCTHYIHRYDQKSRTVCYLCLTFGKCAQGARQKGTKAPRLTTPRFDFTQVAICFKTFFHPYSFLTRYDVPLA